MTSFVIQEAVGIDVELLNEIQVKILEVYSLRALSCCEPLLESSYTLCASSMETALYKATNHLLDDLSRNARLLGTPERYKLAFSPWHIFDFRSHLLLDATNSSFNFDKDFCFHAVKLHCQYRSLPPGFGMASPITLFSDLQSIEWASQLMHPILACRAQVVLAAVQSPLLGDRKRASLLIPRICNIILNAPNSCRHVSSEQTADILFRTIVDASRAKSKDVL